MNIVGIMEVLVLSCLLEFCMSYSTKFGLLKGRSNFGLGVCKTFDFDTLKLDVSESYGYANHEEWDFGLLESSDIDAAIEISMESFFRPRLKLGSFAENDMNNFEKVMMNGVIGAFTRFEVFDARLNNWMGYATRCGKRLDDANLHAGKDSIIFAATDKGTDNLVGLVEISLEPPDGRLGPPMKNPLRQEPSSSDQAYLCNLCVVKSRRRRGLAKMLCRLCEDVVGSVWQKNTIYLHVERNNVPAQELYVGQGYALATSPLSSWEVKMLGMDNILYYRKDLWSNNECEEVEGETDGQLELGISEKDLTIASNTMQGWRRKV